MRTLRKFAAPLAVVVIIALVLALGWWVFLRDPHKTITAYFTEAKGIYAGDTVRMLGVEVGTIDSITPVGDHTEVKMKITSDQAVPADAEAVIVAQSLVAERFVQLTPAYQGGPEMEDGATIGVDKTAIPVEWDEIKNELMSLSTALGPDEKNPDGALSDFVDATDSMLDGNGKRAKGTLEELSRTMDTLSQGRTDLFSTVKNLQLFVTALSNSEEQIVAFSGHLASVTDVLNQSTGDLDNALKDLDVALGDIDRFLGNNADKITGSVDKLGQATNVLRERRGDVENLLHVAPTGMANFYNIYHPYQGTLNGVLAPQWLSNPMQFICGAIQSLSNNTAQNDAQLCQSYLAPLVNSMAMNYPDAKITTPSTPSADDTQIDNAQKPGTQTPNGVQPASESPAAVGNDVAAGTDLTTLLAPGGGR
ncbi:MCE family protein [Dietzia sp.]|uniref:MCE family protein n=1 Tax=Dietzia sp. TaxID=1871616 RepID=UPI002FDA6CA9